MGVLHYLSILRGYIIYQLPKSLIEIKNNIENIIIIYFISQYKFTLYYVLLESYYMK